MESKSEFDALLSSIIPSSEVEKKIEDELARRMDLKVRCVEGFEEWLLKDCISGIDKMINTCNTYTVISYDYFSKVCVEDQYLYVHDMLYGFRRGDDWTQRILLGSRISKLIENPFAKIQRLMYKKGYYLLDVSDYNINKKKCLFVLHTRKPENYDGVSKLWHGMDVVKVQ